MRECGILMPVSSLPGPCGIGCFGKEAYKFVDFLAKAGQRVWQILPLSPTGYGDSPYQSCSAFAGNPYFIDLETLAKNKLLKKSEYENLDWGKDPARVDYALLYENRCKVLRTAYSRFKAFPPDEYYTFCFENEDWLNDYALFMTIKERLGMKPWTQWPEPLRLRDPEWLEEVEKQKRTEIGFWKFLQYEFMTQWQALKHYANEKGIEIMGDLPIYVAADSADAWAGRELFETDETGAPRRVAGCPPDYFAKDGQLWGNPIYDWDYHEKTGFAWWISRIRHAFTLYDRVRIDHFRAFDTYYAIPGDAETARVGTWEIGPRMKLFNAITEALGPVPIIAEDLGLMFDSVRELLKESGYPGMKVLQFAFDPETDSEYLPHNYPVNSVAYPGTHDNATAVEWASGFATPAERKKAMTYLGVEKVSELAKGLIRGTLMSPAQLAVIPAADWLGLGAEARMNTPGVGSGNWQWRAQPDIFSAVLANRIRKYCKVFGRVQQEK